MQEESVHISFTDTKIAELRGKQSVRTTFRLPERSIMVLSLLAAQLGIKQKSLFDHLARDMAHLKACALVAGKRQKTSPGIAKTYVISKKTLENLEDAASSCNASRDALVALSIDRLLPLLAQEQKRHKRRKQVLADTSEWLREGYALLDQSRACLGDDDPAVLAILTMLRGAGKPFATLEDMVERGKRIEEF